MAEQQKPATDGGELDNLMAEFDDDEDFNFLASMPLPGGAPPAVPGGGGTTNN